MINSVLPLALLTAPDLAAETEIYWVFSSVQAMELGSVMKTEVTLARASGPVMAPNSGLETAMQSVHMLETE